MVTQGFDFDTFYGKLIRWVVLSNQPFSEIESVEFRDLLQCLRPSLKNHIVDTDQLRRDIQLASGECIYDFKTFLKIAFLAIIGSFIDENWCLREAVLAFTEIKGELNGLNLSNVLTSTIKELELSDKVITVTGNNVSDNGTLMAEMRHQLDVLHRTRHVGDSPANKWDSERATIRSLAHILHLAVMALLAGAKAIPSSTPLVLEETFSMTEEDAEALHPLPDRLDDANGNGQGTYFNNYNLDDALAPDDIDLSSPIEKVRQVMKITRLSRQGLQLWMNTVRSHLEQAKSSVSRRGLPSTLSSPPLTRIKGPILDVATRWNSTMYMLDRALEFRVVIDDLCTTLGYPAVYRQYRISPQDWEIIKKVCEWLKLFEQGTKYMSSIKYPTLSSALQTYIVLLKYVKSLNHDPLVLIHPTLQSAVVACEAKFNKFFNLATFKSDYYYFATLLDPRLKRALFDTNSEFFSDEWVQGCHKSFIEEMTTRFSLSRDPTPPPTLPDDPFLAAIAASMSSISAQGPNEKKKELERYMIEHRAQLMDDPLAWWKLHGHRYPTLSKMARDYLPIPGSSVCVERCLNTERDVIDLRRTSLKAKPSTMGMLMRFKSILILEKDLTEASIGKKRKRV